MNVHIQLVEGDTAPTYPGAVEATLDRVVITEQGTVANLPIVDLVCKTLDGRQVLVVMTGRIACAIAAAVRGVNQRNHGVAEP